MKVAATKDLTTGAKVIKMKGSYDNETIFRFRFSFLLI